MKIAIEALGVHDFGGGRTATMNLLEGLFELDSENEYMVILSKAEPSLAVGAENVQQWVAPFRNRFLMRLWAQIILPLQLRNYDLVHFAKNLGIFGLNCPSIVTMYDMTTLLHADIFPWMDVWYWKNIQKKTLEQASTVIAISEATANDVQHYYGLDQNKIVVIYPSISPEFRPVSAEKIQSVKKKYDLPDRYLLHVGRIDKKKNLTLLIEAFAKTKSNYQLGGDIKLILVGGVYYKSQDDHIQPTIDRLGLDKDVIFTGRVSDDDLPAIYSGALIFISPSLHEGFGLVAVESIACGTPVIAHRSGGVGEALGSAAILLDHITTENLAEAIGHLLRDAAYRESMVVKGLSQAKKFNRNINAQQTLDLYEKILQQ